MKRNIGFTGAVAIIVGYVVGASIFILPGELAATAGPGVFVSYLLAAIPALFVCFVSAQIGAVFPVTGAGYVCVSRVVSPYAGFLVVWSLIAVTVIAQALLAHGLANYAAFFFPALPRLYVALATVLFFMVVNLMGARASVDLQTPMVAIFLFALTVFTLGGAPHLEPARLSPLFPNGFSPVAAAAVPAYFSFMGFQIIMEIGGEIRNPQRTIPWALGVSFLCILFFYLAVSVTVPGLVPWQELSETTAPVATAAATFLPGPAAGFIAFSALFAAATSINGIFLTHSRDVFTLARDKILPSSLGYLDARFGTPTRAVLLLGLLSVVGVAVSGTITQYATLIVLSGMVFQILYGVALLVLPKRYPEWLAGAPFRLSPRVRTAVSAGLILYSIAFIAVACRENPAGAVVFLVFLFVGSLYYWFRKRALESTGVTLESLLRKDAMEA